MLTGKSANEGIYVIAAYNVKGMEFDAVIIAFIRGYFSIKTSVKDSLSDTPSDFLKEMVTVKRYSSSKLDEIF